MAVLNGFRKRRLLSSIIASYSRPEPSLPESAFKIAYRLGVSIRNLNAWHGPAVNFHAVNRPDSVWATFPHRSSGAWVVGRGFQTAIGSVNAAATGRSVAV